MSRRQQKIVMPASRYRRYFVRNTSAREDVIPDTPAAHAWAIEKGATQFGALSFHRLDLDGMPAPYQQGDFYCRLVNRDLETGSGPLGDMLDLFAVPGRRRPVLIPASSRLVYLSKNTVGLRIDAKFFRKERGFRHLNIYYDLFSKHLQQAALDWGIRSIEVMYDGRADIENTEFFNRVFSIPIHRDELCGERDRPINLPIDTHRHVPLVQCRDLINLELDLTLARNANSRAAARGLGAYWPLPSDLPAIAWSPAVECAKRLARWLRNGRIEEFRRYNALRAVVGSFKLDTDHKGNLGGVADALQILMTHGFIRECPTLSFQYPCKRQSPWFVVNPAVINRF